MTAPANLSCVMSVRDTTTVSVSPQSDTPVESVKGFAKHARVPESVGSDPKLRAKDVRIYYALSLAERNGRATIGQRLLARSACMAQQHVSGSLVRLEAAGHIQVERRRRARSSYVLLAAMFRRVSIAPVEPSALHPQHVIIRCPRCSRSVRQVLKIGWCRSCQHDIKLTAKMELVARRVIAETA